MSRPQARARGSFAQDTLTAEFTTGQIVIMACGALAVACVMFALGVLVGRYDPTNPAEAAAMAEAPAAEGATTESSTPPPPVVVAAKAQPEPAKSATTVEAPKVEMPPPAQPAAAVAAMPETSSDTKPEAPASPAEESKETVVASASPATATLKDSVKPRITRVEPLPLGPGGTRVQQVPAAEAAPAEAAPAETKPAEAKPAEAKPAETKPAESKPASIEEMDDDSKLMMEELPEKVAKAEPREEKKPAASAPAGGNVSGKFGIQIASFKGSAGKAKADDYAKRVSGMTGHAASVAVAGDVYRVMIGGFSDKAAATGACNKLKQNPEFKDAFVKAL